MRLDADHPMNEQVIRHFRGRGGNAAPLPGPDDHPDPYMKLGSHPDVVQRVWEDLGGALPCDCRAIVYGTPALVHPVAGVVLALAYGTAYALRVPIEALDAAIEAGCRPTRRWSGGSETDLEQELGRGWVFGGWSRREPGWLLAGFRLLSSGSPGLPRRRRENP